MYFSFHFVFVSYALDQLSPHPVGPALGVYWNWKEAILDKVVKYSGVVQNRDLEVMNPVVDSPPQMTLKEGILNMRPLAKTIDHDDVWLPCWFKLYPTILSVFSLQCSDESPEGTVGEVIVSCSVSPSCCAFETTLKPFSFEFVTSKILHVCGRDAIDTVEWIRLLRVVIGTSVQDNFEPLFQQALLKIDNDELYFCNITSKVPIGISFEQVGEWAVVQSSTLQSETGISVGSVLCSIQGVSVVLDQFDKTIDRLQDWTLSLKLGFRRVPLKEAILLKESKSRKSNHKKTWKKRKFELNEGKFCYLEKTIDGDFHKVEFHLIKPREKIVSNYYRV